MKIKTLVDEDFVNYKKPSMFIAFSYCSFKCDKEAGCQVCQNSDLANAPIIEVDTWEIINRFLDNDITEAIVCGGLEPFDQFDELGNFLSLFDEYYIRGHNYRKNKPDIVIYTGYYPSELKIQLRRLSCFLKTNWNIIIKCGRFIPNRPHIYDELLGVELASDN